MNVSLLTRYSNYSYPARGLTPANRTRRSVVPEAAQTLPDSGAAARGKLFVKHNPAKPIKHVGYTELSDSWDQYTVSRFVDLIERNTGSALDAGEVMRRYDADGDGLLSMDEQTALIEGLAKSEFEDTNISREVAESIIDQLKELSGRDETRYASGIARAVRQYERLFFYESLEASDEAAVIAV
ncbi:MAG: hypothetical protein LBS84_07195 [Clostridiales bacterium]|jgi:hypothetical protein|nr:hypothetical protein [Clostridiales bacterium]